MLTPTGFMVNNAYPSGPTESCGFGFVAIAAKMAGTSFCHFMATAQIDVSQDELADQFIASFSQQAELLFTWKNVSRLFDRLESSA